MLDKPLVNAFSHVKPGDTPWRSDGLRDFFLYRDLGVAEATGGRVIAQLVKANEAPEKGTGWHQHQADFHIVFMTKGWAKFMYEGKEHMVSAGDCVHQHAPCCSFAQRREWGRPPAPLLQPVPLLERPEGRGEEGQGDVEQVEEGHRMSR